MQRFNFNYKNVTSKTCYSKRELLYQMVPSLNLSYALRTLFKIPSGQGKIVNLDESMQYLFNPDAKEWVWELSPNIILNFYV